MFNRIINLIGEDNFNLIKNKKVLLIGVGGVGSAALETLVRSGFNNITVVDYDIIDESNLNRQLITNNTNIGNKKVEEAIKRALLINKDIIINGIQLKLDDNNIKEILSNNYDYVIDACDTVSVKVDLIKHRNYFKYKLITCCGTAKKIDPTKLEITTLDKTNNDPLAKVLRKKVKDLNIKSKVYVVSSTELPINVETLASMSMVPNTAGILCVSYIINDILKR